LSEVARGTEACEVQEERDANNAKMDELRAQHTAELRKLSSDLAEWKHQALERLNDSSRVHEELLSVRTQLAQSHTESERMYHEQLLPAQVCHPGA
jgi:hypothetical protein